MHPMRLMFAGAVLAAFAAGTGTSFAQLKQEPPVGALGCGQVVLVNDGTCGTGQIKRVRGGCDIARMPGLRPGRATRTSTCVGRMGPGGGLGETGAAPC